MLRYKNIIFWKIAKKVMEKKRQRIENEKHFNDIMFFVNFQSIFLDKFYSKKFLF